MEQDTFDYLSFLCAMEMLAARMNLPGNGAEKVQRVLDILNSVK